MMTDKWIRLTDGRRLGYAEYGDPQGNPIMLFHGNPGSRLGWVPLKGSAYPSGIRIVAPDRPGFGSSSGKPGRSHLDWPDDVAELADALGIERFAVAGVSGGGPFALACAFMMPHRLTGVGVISSGPPVSEALVGVSRTNRLLFWAARNLPGLIHTNSWVLGTMVRKDPRRMLRKMLSAYAAADRAVLARPEVEAILVRDMQEAFRQGGLASAHEVILMSRLWDFPLQEIRTRVHLWHGEEDTATPPSVGRYLARELPDCEATFVRRAGHLLVFDVVHDVVARLASA